MALVLGRRMGAAFVLGLVTLSMTAMLDVFKGADRVTLAGNTGD